MITSFITGKGTLRETTTTQNSPRRPSNEGYAKDKTHHSERRYEPQHFDRFHPTAKPLELIERALLNSSKAGDVVADLFGGRDQH